VRGFRPGRNKHRPARRASPELRADQSRRRDDIGCLTRHPNCFQKKLQPARKHKAGIVDRRLFCFFVISVRASTDSYEFQQAFNRHPGSITTAVWITGALLRPKLFEHMSSRRAPNLRIALVGSPAIAYLLLFTRRRPGAS
jgi:hypothetical protein